MVNKIIFLILTSCFLLPSSTFAHGGTNDENNIIRMTKNGFEPSELTVTQGDEVIFINNDDVAHWPASNFHPTHTLYPEFDSLKGVLPGESWKFKFEKVGTWRMHDHLFPHLTGTIVVLPDPNQDPKSQTLSTDSQSLTLENPGFWARIKSFFWNLFHKNNIKAPTPLTQKVNVDPNLLKEFKSQNEKAKYAWLEKRAELENPKIAWEYVLAAYNTPAGVIGNPHDMAHLVGQLLYKAYGFDGLSTCTPVFAFGCYHGLMEVAFDGDRGNEPKYKEDLLVAQDGCKQIGPETSPTYWSCIHGMGHGIATYRDHNLDLALKDCDSLASTVQTYCHDGVFMEFSISAPENFYKKTEPIYPCNIIGESYKVACARSQVQVMRLRFGLDTRHISDTCIKTGNEKIIYHCIDALGYFIGQTAEGKPDKIISGCKDIVDDKSAAQCTAAAAGELVFQNASGWQKNVEKICQSLTGDYLIACQKRVDQVKQSYGRN